MVVTITTISAHIPHMPTYHRLITSNTVDLVFIFICPTEEIPRTIPIITMVNMDSITHLLFLVITQPTSTMLDIRMFHTMMLRMGITTILIIVRGMVRIIHQTLGHTMEDTMFQMVMVLTHTIIGRDTMERSTLVGHITMPLPGTMWGPLTQERITQVVLAATPELKEMGDLRESVVLGVTLG